MAIQVRVISDDDWNVLKRIVEANRNILQNTPNRPSTNSQNQDGDDSMAPEVYIALPPSGGIPGLASAASGSGTDNPPTEGDQPGTAICNVYRVAGGKLKLVPGLTKTVHNLSESEIDQDWILIERDKFGTWCPTSSSLSPLSIKRGKLSSPLYSGSRVSPSISSLSVWTFDGVDWNDTDQLLSIYDDGMLGAGNSPLPLGTWVQIVKINGYWFYDGHNCDPSTGTAS